MAIPSATSNRTTLAKPLIAIKCARVPPIWPAPIKVNGLQPQHRGNTEYIINYNALPVPDLEDLMPEIEKLL